MLLPYYLIIYNCRNNKNVYKILMCLDRNVVEISKENITINYKEEKALFIHNKSSLLISQLAFSIRKEKKFKLILINITLLLRLVLL